MAIFFVKFNTFTLAMRAFMCACMSVQLYSSFVKNIIMLLSFYIKFNTFTIAFPPVLLYRREPGSRRQCTPRVGASRARVVPIDKNHYKRLFCTALFGRDLQSERGKYGAGALREACSSINSGGFDQER